MTEISPNPSLNLPPSMILYGAIGTGKTYSLSTLAAAGLKIAYLYTEPRGVDSLYDGLKAIGKLDHLYPRYIPPTSPSWDSLIKTAEIVSRSSYEDLSKLKYGIEKAAYGTMIDVYKCLKDFTTDSSVSIGPVDHLDDSWAFCLDSLSGLNLIAMDLLVGSKPIRHQGEYGVAMDLEERLLNVLTCNLKCFFCLIAHPDREVDEILGGSTVVPGGLGRKLPPKLPRFFSDVVWAHIEGDNFYWSTSQSSITTKQRNLPRGAKLPADFRPIIAKWRSREEEKL